MITRTQQNDNTQHFWHKPNKLAIHTVTQKILEMSHAKPFYRKNSLQYAFARLQFTH